MMFDDVKARLTMREVALCYGFKPNRANKIACPFHSDRTPSLHLYNDRFHCFGCGADGSVIDFTARLFDLTALDAAKKLNDDFSLGLDLDRPPNREDQERRRRTQQARQHFELWREQALTMICKAIRKANCADLDSLSEGEALAVRNREWLEYVAGVLEHGDLENEIEVFRDREGVERLCRMILNDMQTRSKAG